MALHGRILAVKFQKGNQMARRRKESGQKKTVWIMQSLAEHGYDYEKMLVGFLKQASDPAASIFERKTAYDMAALLIKLVPHLANAPKQDHGTTQIETLVIQRLEPAPQRPAIDTTAEETPSA